MAHQATNLQKIAVLYKIDRKVQKLAFKFVGLILLSDCKWQLDAPKQKAAVRPWLDIYTYPRIVSCRESIWSNRCDDRQ